MEEFRSSTQMAAARSFAQHYIECENCEENPAQFLCETCSGHLCESCKSEHERRKISQNHNIIHITSENGDVMKRLYCSKHRNQRLKYYCSPCETPVCTKCMMETHNDHSVQHLATVYDRIIDELEKQKEEIETLLPKYEKLRVKENKKEAEISKRIDEVQREIENHTERVIERFRAMKEKRVQKLRQSSEKPLESIAISKTEIDRRIKSLKEIRTQISNNLGGKPGIIIFKAIKENSLSEMRQYPHSDKYELENFIPGDIEKITQDVDFGNVPKIRSPPSIFFKLDSAEAIAKQLSYLTMFNFEDKKPSFATRQDPDDTV